MRQGHSDTDAAIGFRVWAVATFRAMPRAHTHPDIEINFVAEGFIEYLFGGTKRRVGAGSFAVFWGGVPHQLASCSRGGRGVWLTVPIADFLRWPLPGQLGEKLLGGGFAQGPGEAVAFNRWLADFAQPQPEHRAVLLLELEATLHRLALPGGNSKSGRGAATFTASPGGTAHIARVADYLARYYADELDLPRIAAAVRLNPKYLARIFKAQTRLTVHGYLTRLRVAHAQRLLATTDMRVLDVALQSGFGSQASFYAAFARLGGKGSPHRYRQKSGGAG